MTKGLYFEVFLCVGSMLFTSCNDGNTKQQNTLTQTNFQMEKIDARTLYISNCATCHGVDGRLGASGAKNLAETKLLVDEVKQQIITGKGAMPPFGNQLSDEEIQAVSNYILTELKVK